MENNALSLQPFLVFPIMLRVIKMGRKRNDESTNMAISIVIFYSCTAVPATMFMLSLVFQWILVPDLMLISLAMNKCMLLSK